ncbi:MAG: hypothetical protein II956_07320 [Bacteroidales bacterium]|nr:hypothetical protein [Bacteroidales bacterium]
METNNSKTLSGFKAAVSLILDGDTSAGLEQLEAVEGQEIFKNMVKAEIAYYRDDLKNAMYYDEHALSSDSQWYDPLITVQHLRAYVYAAKKLGSISRAKEFLDYYISVKRSEYDIVGVRPFNDVYYNAMRRLDNQKAHDEPPKVKLLTKETAKGDVIFFSEGVSNDAMMAQAATMALNSMWNVVATDKVISIYEKYAQYITLDTHHLWAARNYIKMNNLEKAEEAVLRVVELWKPSECFQVLPMKFFIFKDLTEFLSAELKEKILKMKKR